MNRRDALLLLTASALSGPACVTAPDATIDPGTGLTGHEHTAVESALEAVQALTVAGSTIEGTTDLPATETLSARAMDMPDLGFCPRVSVDVGKTSGLTLQMTLDFGDEGCAPFSTDYMVTGSASGAFSHSDSMLTVTLDGLQTGDSALDGGIEVRYELGSESVTLTGDWDLMTDAISTAGSGALRYDRAAFQTEIRDYAGTVAGSDASWDLTTDALLLSPSQHNSFIPFAGTLSVSGNDTRPLQITFNDESPATGLVEVSINGGPALEVSLFQL